MASKKLPYKVWSADRSKKKAVTASNLAELIDKGKEKLGTPSEKPVTLVLEEDGTEVDDDEYFQCLEPNSIFLLLKEHESWHPPGYHHADETDSWTPHSSDSGSRSLQELAAVLREDLTRIITFSNNEMQVIVDSETTELKSLLGPKAEDAALVQRSCQRHLDDRDKTMEAVQLLKMLDKCGQDLTSSPKRKKVE